MATTVVVNLSKKCNPRENQEDFRRSTNGCVYIGRKTPWTIFDEDSPWHNPYKVDRKGKKMGGTREEVLEKYRNHILSRPDLIERLPELVGKRLGCWCAPLPCHGNVLIELLTERGLI